MKKIMASFIALGILGMLITSCKKEKTPDNANDLVGTYSFKYLTAKTTSTLTASDGEKLITSTDYTTTENKGTVVFTASEVTSTNFGYSIDSETKTSFYMNDKLIDTDTQPFDFTVPLTSGHSNYKLVGSDSIYFPQGGFITGLSADGSNALMASGGGYTFDGKTLTLLQNLYKDSSYTQMGYKFHAIQTVIGSVILEKQ